MRIGVCHSVGATALNEGISTDVEYYKIIKNAGFYGIDAGIHGNHAPREIFYQDRSVWTKYVKDQKKLMDDCGLAVHQIHGTYPTEYDGGDQLTEKSLDNFKKEIEVAALFGCQYIVIHPLRYAVGNVGKERDFELNMQMFEWLAPALKDNNVQLGVENMLVVDDMRLHLCGTGCTFGDDMVRYIDEANRITNSDRFVGCLDTGHVFICGETPDVTVRKLGSRLKLLHIHDNDGLKDNHILPGMGKIDWEAFTKALADVDYNGVISLENNQSRLRGMLKSSIKTSAEIATVLADMVEEYKNK